MIILLVLSIIAFVSIMLFAKRLKIAIRLALAIVICLPLACNSQSLHKKELLMLQRKQGWKIVFFQGEYGKILYLLDLSGRVQKLDLGRLSIKKSSLGSPSIDSKNDKLYLVESDMESPSESLIVEIDMQNKKRRIVLKCNPFSLSVSPNGRFLAFTGKHNGARGLFVVNSATGKVYLHIRGVNTACSPSWGPESKRLAYCSKDDFIYILDMNNFSKMRLVHGSFPSWVPSTNLISYRELKRYYLIDINTRQKNDFLDAEKRLNFLGKVAGMGGPLLWSPDGRYALFYHIGTMFCDVTEQYVIYLIERNTREIIRVGSIRGPIVGISWGKLNCSDIGAN
ncbi:MAG: hypothetical protein B1H08_04545 [Candidatus Omnitrophica bacterium 4484_171]|nr:MAG: hypothetical protein B1H08_04545 [Candidatus Omnitrophica bacterium 4484_171]